MIIFLIEILSVFICAMIFSTIIIDERKSKRRALRVVKLDGFWNGEDRRANDRLNVALEVKYCINTKLVTTKSMDISTKGIRLLLDEKIERMTPVQLEIKIPAQNRLIKATGEVVWAKELREREKTSAKRLFNTGIKLFKFQNAGEKKLFDFIYSLRAQKS